MLQGMVLLRRVVQPVTRRWASSEAAAEPAKTWWHNAKFWGGLGSAAAWGMTVCASLYKLLRMFDFSS